MTEALHKEGYPGDPSYLPQDASETDIESEYSLIGRILNKQKMEFQVGEDFKQKFGITPEQASCAMGAIKQDCEESEEVT